MYKHLSPKRQPGCVTWSTRHFIVFYLNLAPMLGSHIKGHSFSVNPSLYQYYQGLYPMGLVPRSPRVFNTIAYA